MKKFMMAILVLFIISGCVIQQQKLTLNTLDIAVAAKNFNDVVQIIDSREDQFSESDWSLYTNAKKGFKTVIDQAILPGNVISTNDIIDGIEAVEGVYTSCANVIRENRDKFTRNELIILVDFDARLRRIKASTIVAINSDDLALQRKAADDFLVLVRTLAQLAPLFL